MKTDDLWIRPVSYPESEIPILCGYHVHRAADVKLTQQEITEAEGEVRRYLNYWNPELLCKSVARKEELDSLKKINGFKFFVLLFTLDLVLCSLFRGSPQIFVVILAIAFCGKWFLQFFSEAQNEAVENEIRDYVASHVQQNMLTYCDKKAQAMTDGAKSAADRQNAVILENAGRKHRDARDQLDKQCGKLLSEAVNILTRQHERIDAVEKALQKLWNTIREAEKLYKENRYSRFWNSIDDSIAALEDCKRKLIQLRGASSRRYYEIRRAHNTNNNLPHFPIPKIDLQAPRKALAMIRALTEKAETVFEFASIFEMQNTQREIAKGFKNLQATIRTASQNISDTITQTGIYLSLELRLMRDGIVASIEDAAQNISCSVIDASDSNREALHALRDATIEMGAEVAQITQSSSESQRSVLELIERDAREQVDALDDIRRGRIPVGDDPRKSVTKPK